MPDGLPAPRVLRAAGGAARRADAVRSTAAGAHLCCLAACWGPIEGVRGGGELEPRRPRRHNRGFAHAGVLSPRAQRRRSPPPCHICASAQASFYGCHRRQWGLPATCRGESFPAAPPLAPLAQPCVVSGHIGVGQAAAGRLRPLSTRSNPLRPPLPPPLPPRSLLCPAALTPLLFRTPLPTGAGTHKQDPTERGAWRPSRAGSRVRHEGRFARGGARGRARPRKWALAGCLRPRPAWHACALPRGSLSVCRACSSQPSVAPPPTLPCAPPPLQPQATSAAASGGGKRTALLPQKVARRILG